MEERDMRRSKAEAAQTREHIVRTAAALFRAKGINGIGVADLMQHAGLTHGGFYKHFDSKQTLVAEACEQALSQARDSLAAAAEKASPGKRLAAVVDGYLTTAHRDHPEQGCAIAALGAEAARDDGQARQAMAAGSRRLIDLVAAQLPEQDPGRAQQEAAAIVSAMVGALVVARTIDDAELSESVLSSARDFILSRYGGATAAG